MINSILLGLDSYFLKLAVDIICVPLTNMFNVSFGNGNVISDWKTARITPVYNAKELKQLGFYKPIQRTYSFNF